MGAWFATPRGDIVRVDAGDAESFQEEPLGGGGGGPAEDLETDAGPLTR
jgi:hypothetical protein